MGTEPLGYIDGLRQKVGHAPIIMSAAGCAVLDDAGRVLLQQRGDEVRTWCLPGGAIELGETVGEAAIRETREETGLDVRLQELLGVYTAGLHTYDNGDVVQAVVIMLTATAVGGALAVDGAETVGLSWSALDDLPGPIFSPHEPMLEDLRSGRRGAWT